VADKGSYFSRFTLKLVEMVAAGIATAVSGYLVAHLGGYMFASAPTPAAVQVAPNAKEAANPPAAPAARTSANTTQAVPARKHPATGMSAAESKPREKESVEAEVRAALAKVDANQPAPPDVPPRQADIPPTPPVAGPEPGSAVGSVGADAAATAPHSAAAAPRAADLQPQPAQQDPIQSEPLTAVEIKSRPVAAVEPLPPPATAPPAQENAQGEDNGLLSAIKKIPDLLRSNSPAPDSQPPRPPLPVSE